MLSAIKYRDYEEKSIKEMLMPCMFIQLILLFVDIGKLIFKILCSKIQDIVDSVFRTLHTLFVEDGELMHMMQYVMPFMYFMKAD